MRTLRRKLRRDLAHQRGQLLSVAITLALGVALFGATFDAHRNLSSSYDAMYERTAFADLTVSGGAGFDAAEAFDALGAADGVAAAERRAQADVAMQLHRSTGDHELLGRLVGLPASGQPVLDQVVVVEGALASDALAVEQHLADHEDLHPGDDLTVRGPQGWVDLPIAAVVASPEYLWPARDRQAVFTTADDFGVAFAPAAVFADVVPERAREQQVLVGLDADAAPGTLEALREVALDAGATEVLTRDQHPSNAALQTDLEGFATLSVLFPGLFLVAGAMAAMVLLTRLVQTQRTTIGLLAAEGFDPSTILRHYLAYGAAIGLLAALPGALLGVVLARLIASAYTDALGIPLAVVRFRPATPAIGVGLAVATALVAVWAPARRAARLDPATAMRSSPPALTHRGTSLAERLLPPLRRLRPSTRSVLRSIGRNRARSASTVLGASLAIVLILVSAGMLDSATILIGRYFGTVQRQDLTVVLDAPTPTDELDAVMTVPGVAVAEPVLEVPLTVEREGRSAGTLLVGLPADSQLHALYAPGGDRVPVPTDGVVLAVALRDQLGVDVGDAVALRSPLLDGPTEVTVAGFVEEVLGGNSYAGRPALAALAGVAPEALPATSVLVRVDEGAEPATVAGALRDLDGVAGVRDLAVLREATQELLALFYAILGIMLLFGLVMATALVYNTLTINAAERAGELATLVAAGVDERRAARLLSRENLLLVVIGVPVGLVVGRLVATAFMASFSNDLVRFSLQMRPGTPVWVSGVVLAVGALAGIPARRAVARLDLAHVVRERST